MATRPINTADWAINETTQTINGVTYLNKFEPSQGYKNDGVLFLEPWSRPLLNYQLSTISAWLRYINENFFDIGYVYTETHNVNPATTLGHGTWSNIGSQLVGSTTVYYWERVA